MPTVGPVDWGSHPPELLETVVAVLVAQDHPDAQRRTPSSGDGGVDILIPKDAGWHVKQVKGFTGRMDNSKRRQVEKSYELVLTRPRLTKPIVEWRLTVPIDPTSGEQEWFEDLTKEAPFDCGWEGAIHWNGLAAKHRCVIDYYFRDGRDRVEQRAKALLDAAQAVSGPLTPMDVAGHLKMLMAALNADDPHYRYAFAVGESGDVGGPAQAAGAILSVTGPIQGGEVLTTHVFAKHRYSTDDAPIGGTLTARLHDPDKGIDLRQAFDDFRTYGTPLEIPMGMLDVTLKAPGGLGGTFEGAAGRLGNQVSGVGLRFRVRMLDESGHDLVTLDVSSSGGTTGELGGMRFRLGTDPPNLTFTFSVNPSEERFDVNFKLGDLTGQPVGDVIDVARFVSYLRSPFRFQLLPAHGIKPLAEALPTGEDGLIDEWILQLMDDLHVVQQHAAGPVRIPSSMSDPMMAELRMTAKLFRDGVVEAASATIDVELAEEDTPQSRLAELGREERIIVVHDHKLRLPKETHALGTIYLTGDRVELAQSQSEDPEFMTIELRSSNGPINIQTDPPLS